MVFDGLQSEPTRLLGGPKAGNGLLYDIAEVQATIVFRQDPQKPVPDAE